MPSSWLLSFPSYFIPTSANKERNNGSQGMHPCHFSLAYFGRWTLMIYVFPNSFEQVTVDRIQIRSRSCSSCNSFGGCRFGVASTKNDCLLHQQRPHQFTLSSGYKKVKHPNLISIDYAHALRLTGLACDPVSNTNAPINILVRSINL